MGGLIAHPPHINQLIKLYPLTPFPLLLTAQTTFQRSILFILYWDLTSRLVSLINPSRDRSVLHPTFFVMGEINASNFAMILLGLGRWFTRMMFPPFLQTLFISAMAFTGSGTTLTTWVEMT